jgi:hypothetical protein
MTALLKKWNEIRHSFTHTPQTLQLVWRTNPRATVGLGFLTGWFHGGHELSVASLTDLPGDLSY